MSVFLLRDVKKDDIEDFFKLQRDPDANYMAAFTMEDPNNWEFFSTHWGKVILNDAIIKQTIVVNDDVVGNVLCFEQFGEKEISYWIDRKHWGKGIATNALNRFLIDLTTRPLYARAVKDNIGSRRVLEKCGFTITGESSGFSNARGMEVEEFIFTLRS